MIRPFLPQGPAGLQRPAGPSTSCPSPKRLSNSLSTLSIETLEEARNRRTILTSQLLAHHTTTREEEIAMYAALTGYFQRGVVAHCLPQVVAGNTNVGTFIRLASPSVDDAQKEEGAAGEQHALRAGIVPVGLHPFAIFVPLHSRGWPTLRLTVESGGFPLGDDQIRRVLDNPGWGVLLTETRS